MKFYQNMKYYREQASMSEYTLARLIGVDVEKINAWERGSQKPDAATIHFIACALNVDDAVLTDPGPLPEKKPERAEVKHEHPAFDGGVLGQPEGIYGSSKPEPEKDRIGVRIEKDDSASRVSATDGKKNSLSAAEQARLHPVFASDRKKKDSTASTGDFHIWAGKPHEEKGGSGNRIFLIVLAFIFFIVFCANLSDGESIAFPLIVLGIVVIWFSVFSKKEKEYKRIVRSTDYYLTDRKIVISTPKTELNVSFDIIKGIRIVNEKQDTKRGTIIIDTFGKEKITTVPKISEDNPEAILYNVSDVRDVFQKINAAYRNYQKSKE